MSTSAAYKPTETHQTLYKKISELRASGESYDKIGEKLLPNEPTRAKGIVWRAHKKNEWPTDNATRMDLGLPKLITVQEIPGTIPQAPACPTCGGACTYDCGKQRPTAKPGTGRQRAPRAEIALTDLDALVVRLGKLTGKKWSYE